MHNPISLMQSVVEDGGNSYFANNHGEVTSILKAVINALTVNKISRFLVFSSDFLVNLVNNCIQTILSTCAFSLDPRGKMSPVR